jgi:hypothetical protein
MGNASRSDRLRAVLYNCLLAADDRSRRTRADSARFARPATSDRAEHLAVAKRD